jgi:hypothetical protein
VIPSIQTGAHRWILFWWLLHIKSDLVVNDYRYNLCVIVNCKKGKKCKKEKDTTLVLQEVDEDSGSDS